MKLRAMVMVLGLLLPSLATAEWAHGQVQATASRLAQALRMPPDKRAAVETRLASLLRDPRFAAKYGALGIYGVFAYQMGEGGLLVKVKKGHGISRLEGEAGDVRLMIKSVTVGAQIGGSSEWGIGLVLGLRDARGFGGDYSVETVAATFADASNSMMALTSKNPTAPHQLYLIGSASGASANAGGGSLTILVQR
jgi:hypothetical protein